MSLCFMQAGALGVFSYSAGIFFQPVVNELGIGLGAIAAHTSIRSLTMAVSMPLVSKLLPGKNIGKIISINMLVCCVMFGLMSQFTSIYQWYMAAVIMGFSTGFIFFVPTPLLINNWFKEKAGFATGFALMFSGLGGALFTPLGTWIIENYSWRLAYIIMACIAAVLVIPLTFFVIRFKPSDMGLLPYGAKVDNNKNGITQKKAITSSDSGKINLNNLLDDKKSKYLFLLVFITSCFMSFAACYVQYFPSYAKFIGLSPAVGATIASSAMIGSVIWKLALGWLNDKVGVKKATYIGLTSIITSFSIIITLYNNVGLLVFATLLYGAGPAMMAISPPMLTKKVFGIEGFGAVFSYITIGTSIVAAVATTSIGSLYDAFGNYVYGFSFGILCCVMAAVLITVTMELKKNSTI